MTAEKVVINRLLTGISGLDQVLGGGLPEFSFNLIAGAPGSGKTTLAHQIMFALATEARPALYFTVLGEPPLKMLRYQQQFGFFDTSRINHSVHFISLAEEVAAGDLAKVLKRISTEVEKREPGLIFVDSFRSVVIASEAADTSFMNLQLFVQQLGTLLTGWQATTFLLGEYFAENEPSPVFTIADGLIWLRQSVQRNSVVRKMEITKMRGQATQPGLHTFRIVPAGIDVFAVPPAPRADTQPPDVRVRIKTGVEGLDAMMGGGLPRGYSLLVAGPSGAGKSIVAAAFLIEGARAGETGVIAAFEQRPNRSRGPQIAQLVDSGQLGVVDTSDPGISVDEIAMLLVAEVRRLKATRVVIDSLSGFELALAPTFREDFREALARLVTALAATGATVLMTSELEDRYDELSFSPYGTAFLTDAIIVQRYIEVDSRLQRVMGVVKVRASAHSTDLRLYSIDESGLRLGTTLADHEGLLGGRPTRTK
jgi:circadian clock protein KaiC